MHNQISAQPKGFRTMLDAKQAQLDALKDEAQRLNGGAITYLTTWIAKATRDV